MAPTVGAQIFWNSPDAAAMLSRGKFMMNIQLAHRAAFQAFLVAAVALATQILTHRMISAKLLNNYAFLVISLTMLGFALAGVILSRWLARFLESLPDSINQCMALFALTMVVCTTVFYRSAVGPQLLETRSEFIQALLAYLPLALLYALPFAFLGLVLGALLSDPGLPTRKIYCFDLVGSALGALLVLPAISVWGVEPSVLMFCSLAVVGSWVLFPPRLASTRWICAGAMTVVLAAALMPRAFFTMRYPEKSVLWEGSQPNGDTQIEHMAWDPISRIEVSTVHRMYDPWKFNYPSLIGRNPDFLKRFKKVLTQNNFAFTYAVDYDGTRESLKGIEETIYSAAYQATSVTRPKVLVIGVGGGFDILNALNFDASEVTGVEVNAATLKILRETYRDYFQHWVGDPRVKLIHDDGRHHLAASQDKYDIIQLSGVDTYTGTAGAAHVFSESYLYTEEAFRLYFSRLSPSGIINVMRLEFIPAREMLRALTTALRALRREGIADPSRHIAMVTATAANFSALLIRKEPFLPAELAALQKWASASPFFRVSAGVGFPKQPQSIYQAFLTLGSEELEDATARAYSFDINPVDDDRPFFFKYSFWNHLFTKEPEVLASLPVMELSLSIMAALVGLFVIVCVYLPLRYLAPTEGLPPGTWRSGVAFAGTGIGYLLIEMALLQKFGLFLGHPNYALSVVLASLLLATGLGSLWSERILNGFRSLKNVSYALAACIFLELLLVFPKLPGWIAWPTGARVLLVFALVLPIGVLLGVFVPALINELKKSAPPFIPWAWGLNGIFSVLAPVLSIGISMSLGMSMLLLCAVPVYCLVGMVQAGSVRSRPKD